MEEPLGMSPVAGVPAIEAELESGEVLPEMGMAQTAGEKWELGAWPWKHDSEQPDEVTVIGNGWEPLNIIVTNLGQMLLIVRRRIVA